MHPTFRSKSCYRHVQQRGKEDTSTEPLLWIHPITRHRASRHSPSGKPEKPKDEAKASFALVVVASYHKRFNISFWFGPLSCSRSCAAAVTYQIWTLQNRGIATLFRKSKALSASHSDAITMCTEQELAEEINSAYKEQRTSELPREILTFLKCKPV